MFYSRITARRRDEEETEHKRKGNLEMKDLVLGKNDTDNLCVLDKKWGWTVRTLFWSSFTTQLVHVFERL